MSTNEKSDQSLVAENASLSGAGFYIPFLEKLKLYQNYLRQDSIWEKNKNVYWKHEKALLQWSASDQHKHLARNIDAEIVFSVYGIGVEKNEGQHEFKSIKPPDLLSLDREDLVRQMIKEKGSMIEPLLGNIYMKGFGEPITWGDVLEGDKNHENDQQRNGLKYRIHSVIINRTGLLMGEVINEVEKGSAWKYKATISLIYLALGVSLTAAILVALNQIFEPDISIPTSWFTKKFILELPNWSYYLIILVIYDLYLWLRKF